MFLLYKISSVKKPTFRLLASATALSCSLVACGPKSTSKSNRSDKLFATAAEEAISKKSDAQFELSGSLMEYKELSPSNQRNFTLVSNYVPPKETGKPIATATDKAKSEPVKSDPPPVRVTIKNSKGAAVWTKTQQLKEIKWDLPITESGLYTVWVEAMPVTPTEQPEELLKKQIETDFDQPKVVLASEMRSPNESGERMLHILVSVLGEKAATCPKAEVKFGGDVPSESLQLSPIKEEASSGAKLLFEARYLIKSSDLKGNPIVVVTCSDPAGNVYEVRQPAEALPSNYLVVAEIKGLVAPYEVNGQLTDVTFLKTPEIELTLNLLDALSGEVVAPALYSQIKDSFQIYLTDKAPESTSDLIQSKNLLWSQAFSNEVSIKLPPQLSDLQVLYISAVYKDLLLGQERLLSTVELPIFIDKSPPKITLNTKPNLAKAALDQPITLQGILESDGAPIEAGGLTVEVTKDLKEWTAVPATLIQDKTTVSLTFKYPYTSEMPLRARIKARDVAGYEAVSGTSGQLVGMDPSLLAVSQKDLDQCKIQNSPGSLLKPWLASKFLCRKSDGKGGLSTTPYATLVVQNRGAALPVFYQSASIKAGLGYKIFVDGLEMAANRIEPATAFALDSSKKLLFNMPLNNAWLSANQLEIRTDLEATDVNSTTNSCYSAQAPYGSVIVIDRTAGLSVTLNPFECDIDGTF